MAEEWICDGRRGLIEDFADQDSRAHALGRCRHVPGQRRTPGACCSLLGPAALTFLSSAPRTHQEKGAIFHDVVSFE